MPLSSPYASRLHEIPVVRSSLVVDGVETVYWSYGNAKSSPDILMVHGFRGDHHGLEPIVACLGSELNVVIPDVPGFGESSDLVSPANINSFIAWLLSFAREIHATEQTLILGHSFGSIVVAGALSQGFAKNKAVLINPIAANALQGPRGVLTKLAVLYYKLAAALPERAGFALLKNSLIVRIMSMTMAKTKEPDLRAWIHDQHDQYFSHFTSRSGVLAAFETSVSSDVSSYAEDIDQDVLLLVAELDDITALPQQLVLNELLPHSQIKIVGGVGHLVHYEAPEFAAENIRHFIGRVSS